jgi:ribosomal protein L3 glutamine methyltransferase
MSGSEIKIVKEFLTVRDVLRYAVGRFNASGIAFGQGVSTAVDEAVFLILESLHLPVDDVNPWLDARLMEEERAGLLKLIETRISSRKPAAYLLNKTYVQGVPFYVDERVIVPRSYIGELLFSGSFEDAIAEPERIGRILDLCTGSGCLAILAARLFPRAKIDATDVSGEALEVARRNVRKHDLDDRIAIYEGDLYEPLKNQRYDLILTNPPYVDAEAMARLPAEFRHEPALALDGGKDGLDVVRRILAGAPKHLTREGAIVCEVGRGRPVLEREYSDLDFLWLDTEESSGEVFLITREGLTR